MAKIVKKEDYKSQIDLKTKVDVGTRTDIFDNFKSSGIVSKDALDTQGKIRAILDEATKEAEQIKKEAKEILEQVQEEMEKSKKEGKEQGYQEGLAQALEYLNQIHILKDKMFKNIEPQLVQLSYGIAEKIIHRKIKEDDLVIVEIVRQAAQAAMGQKLTVRVNPDDLKNLKANENLIFNHIESSKTITFKEDKDIQPGGCIIETEVGTIDARLEIQIAAIKKALNVQSSEK